MNLDQAFRSAVAGLIYVFEGLHYWHRGLRSSSLVIRLLFEMKVSELEQPKLPLKMGGLLNL